MGKTAVFVLSSLQQIDTDKPSPEPKVLVLAHTRELASQIAHEFERFSKHFTGVKTACFYGGNPFINDKTVLTEQKPTIIVGTPGRIHQHVREKTLNLKELSIFVLDECDKLLENLGLKSPLLRFFIIR